MKNLLFNLVLTLSLFSWWAAFALLVVNPNFHEELPGYTIGRLCYWELIAGFVAFLIANTMVRKWGSIEFDAGSDRKTISLDHRYLIYFGVWFFVGIAISIWQFWRFSQQF